MKNKGLLIFFIFLPLIFSPVPSYSVSTLSSYSSESSNHKTQSNYNHIASSEKISTYLYPGNSINSSSYFLDYGDFLYINFNSSAIIQENSGISLYLITPSNSSRFISYSSNLVYKFYVNPLTEYSGNYFFEIRYSLGNMLNSRLQIDILIAKLTNLPVTFNISQPVYISDHFNYSLWTPINPDKDSVYYNVYFKQDWNKNNSSFTQLINHTTDPIYFIRNLYNQLSNDNYIFRIYCNETFFAFNRLFNTTYVYNFNVTVDNISPIIISKPSNYTMDTNNFSVTLIWTALDKNPSIYQVYLNNSLQFTAKWSDNEQNYYLIKYPGLGDYNYTIVVFDKANNTATFSFMINVIPGKLMQNEFNILPIFLVILIPFVAKIPSSIKALKKLKL